jgi:AhpD family alkylhydroperoxidase
MGRHAQVIDDLKEPTRSLRFAMGAPWAEFTRLHGAAMAEGALSSKTKELIALAIAVAKQCDGCIAYHAKAAAHHGATEEEVAEALGVALLMAGGPASVYGPRAWDAYCEFAEPHRARREVSLAS